MGCSSSVEATQAAGKSQHGGDVRWSSPSEVKWSSRNPVSARQLRWPLEQLFNGTSSNIGADVLAYGENSIRGTRTLTQTLWTKAEAADVAGATMPFLPARVANAFAQGHLTPLCDTASSSVAVASPTPRSLAAALLIVDVSGFTKLSEDAQRRLGAEGVERFSLALSAFFAIMIKLIMQYHGDVDCFAGDAVLVVFEPFPTGGAVRAGLCDPAKRALLCAQAIHSRLDGFRNDPEDPPLSMHSALSAGT
jgi:hypothetical protein